VPRKLSQKHAASLAARMNWSSYDLLGEIQVTLAALADLECRYEIVHERLQQGSAAPGCCAGEALPAGARAICSALERTRAPHPGQPMSR
jgi:hypothetical protein